jgi:hypothetical protein
MMAREWGIFLTNHDLVGQKMLGRPVVFMIKWVKIGGVTRRMDL